MLALWFVGAAIEMSHGWLASMLIFTLSAVGGTVLSAIFLPATISVGASGGIFGMYPAWSVIDAVVSLQNNGSHEFVLFGARRFYRSVPR